MRRSGLMPLFVIVLIALGSLVAVFVSSWSPKLGLDLAGGFSVTLQPVEDVSEDALDQAIEIIRTRVDALGVGEPEITRQGETIVVNLPGVTDSERARRLVGQTAELTFRPVLCQAATEEQLQQIEDASTSTTEAEDEGSTTTEKDGSTTTTEKDRPTTTEATGDEGSGDGSSVTGQAAIPAVPYQDDSTATDEETSTTRPDEDATTTTAPDEGSTTTVPPAATDTDPICAAIQGGDLDPETHAVTPRRELEIDQPATLDFPDEGSRYRFGTAQQTISGERTVDMTGEILSDARAELGPTGQWTVAIDIKGGQAGEAFNALAAACFGQQPSCPSGQSGIVLDNEAVSVLGFQEPTFEGTAVISGSFTEQEAKDLALVLRYGALPVALETQQTQEVSPTLGQDSLDAGLISGIVGLILVAIYLISYYRLLGLIAVASLTISGALLWALISWLGETNGLTLTLAGITGIIVSIGIAVDSNIVVFEDLKEEVAKGRSLRSAANGAYSAAWTTIVKADSSSLIGAFLLYWLTVGPVRGFAFYLGLSTLLDLVSSRFFVRPLVLRVSRSRRYQDNVRPLGLRPPEVAPT